MVMTAASSRNSASWRCSFLEAQEQTGKHSHSSPKLMIFFTGLLEKPGESQVQCLPAVHVQSASCRNCTVHDIEALFSTSFMSKLQWHAAHDTRNHQTYAMNGQRFIRTDGLLHTACVSARNRPQPDASAGKSDRPGLNALSQTTSCNHSGTGAA